MTTPWISSIRPTLRLPSPLAARVLRLGAGFHVGSLAEAFGPGDDFQNLLRDLRLAFAVHLQGQVLDDVPRVLDALRIAVMRAPCSEAVDSSSARKIEIST